jgi:hypothetical protein
MNSKATIQMALDELTHIKQFCLNEFGIGLVNEVVLMGLREELAKLEENHD